MVRAQPVVADDINEVARLRLAALDTRDSLRRLAAQITAAFSDPQLQAEALATAQRVARTYGDLLRLASQDFGRSRLNRKPQPPGSGQF